MSCRPTRSMIFTMETLMLAQLSQYRGPPETLKQPLVAGGYLVGLCCSRMFFLGAHVHWNRNYLTFQHITKGMSRLLYILFFFLGPVTSISQAFPVQFLKRFMPASVGQKKSNRLVGPSLFNRSEQRDCILSRVSCL